MDSALTGPTGRARVDQHVEPFSAIKRDGPLDDAIAEELVRDRLARAERVAGRIVDLGASRVHQDRHTTRWPMRLAALSTWGT